MTYTGWSSFSMPGTVRSSCGESSAGASACGRRRPSRRRPPLSRGVSLSRGCMTLLTSVVATSSGPGERQIDALRVNGDPLVLHAWITVALRTGQLEQPVADAIPSVSRRRPQVALLEAGGSGEPRLLDGAGARRHREVECAGARHAQRAAGRRLPELHAAAEPGGRQALPRRSLALHRRRPDDPLGRVPLRRHGELHPVACRQGGHVAVGSEGDVDELSGNAAARRARHDDRAGALQHGALQRLAVGGVREVHVARRHRLRAHLPPRPRS